MDAVSCAINVLSVQAPPKQLGENNVGRKLVTFPKDIWGDYFLKISPNAEKLDSWRVRAKELKERVLDILSCAKGAEQVHIIDALYHLGVSYQFEKEIEEALKNMFNTYNNDASTEDDLYTLALRFRLLRQNGFHAFTKALNKFKDAQGSFREDLASDVMGLLSLYEASYTGTVDDLILDEALAFTKEHLKAALPHLDSHLAERVSHSLELPLHKRIQRLEAREFISLCEKDNSMVNKELLEFAKLDYNILQALHQWELKELTKWWKKLNLFGKMTFARDRITEIYFYISGFFFEPQYSRGRIIGSKIVAICSVLDDEYDVYGTLDELQVFTDAICRLDVATMENLPEYVKPLYEAIFFSLKEFEEELAREGNAYRVNYLREEVKNLCKSYLQEAKWLHQRYTPTLEQYFLVSEMSSVHTVIYNGCFVGCGEIATKEVFEWFQAFPKLLRDSARIGRIADDIMSCKFEQSRGHCASAVECCMEEHQCTKEVALENLDGVLGRAWKDMNKACMRPTPFPMEVLRPIVNLARLAQIIYQYEDGYTFSGGKSKERISMLYKDPIPV